MKEVWILCPSQPVTDTQNKYLGRFIKLIESRIDDIKLTEN